jgi:hypothetical protein
MRNGLQAWDADTHVNPAAEVLERYVDPPFRPRLADLAPYRIATSQIGGTPDWHQYRVDTKLYRRILLQTDLNLGGWTQAGLALKAKDAGPERR